MPYVKNKQDMAAHLLGWAALKHRDYWEPWRLLALDIAGANTEIKAIVGTVRRGSPLYLGDARKWVHTDKEVAYKKWEGLAAPRIEHAFFLPDPGPESVEYVACSKFFPSEDQFIKYLDVHSVYVVLPQWKHTLFEAGQKERLIQALECGGSIEWAFAIQTSGWDELIDRLVKAGELEVV